MSILGVVLRTKPHQVDAVVERLAPLPGVDLALNPGDGRLVLVIEDVAEGAAQGVTAAGTLAAIAQWPELLDTSLVYEYSGPDAPPPGSAAAMAFSAWRADPGAGEATAALNQFKDAATGKP